MVILRIFGLNIPKVELENFYVASHLVKVLAQNHLLTSKWR